MATVSLIGLTKRFGDTPAVEDLDLEIGDGEFVSLLGPSGCGKSTTLRLIAGFLEPDAGEIKMGREVISSPSVMLPPERRSMSMIFQSYAIWPHLTVFQNVAYGLKFKNVSRQDADTRVIKFLRLVRLDSFKHRYPAELSGGQQQRVALARALVVEPQILLMDEPLSNLDANLREEMRFEIRRLHEEFKITTIYVTHDQAEAMATSDRIAVLNQGQMIQAGTPGEIFEHPRTRFVAEFVGKANILTGRWDGDGKMVLAEGSKIHVSRDREAPASGERAVCLRPHNILLTSDENKARDFEQSGFNVFPGAVRRLIYFGDMIDYSIDLSPHGALRVIRPPGERYQNGQRIYAVAHPDHCVVVKEG